MLVTHEWSLTVAPPTDGSAIGLATLEMPDGSAHRSRLDFGKVMLIDAHDWPVQPEQDMLLRAIRLTGATPRPTISVIIPFWSDNGRHDSMLAECVASLNGQFDELLVMSNQPTPDGRAEFAKYVNLGLHLAHGDYRLVLNSDTKLLAGNLRDLCRPGVITSPVINGEPVVFHGCCFCVPATVYAAHGGLDEQFIGNFEDLDYALRMYRAAVPMENARTVSIWHHGGATYQFLNQREMMGGDNLRLFVERWGRWITLPELMAEDRAAGRFVEPQYPC